MSRSTPPSPPPWAGLTRITNIDFFLTREIVFELFEFHVVTLKQHWFRLFKTKPFTGKADMFTS